MLSRYATIMLLRGFLRNLNIARDTIRKRSSSARSLNSVLAEIENFFVNGLGVPSIVSELKEYTGRPEHFAWHLTDYTEVEPICEGAEPRKPVDQLRGTMEPQVA